MVSTKSQSRFATHYLWSLWTCNNYVFTKLDLHRVYNLIRIREGDEWKIAFTTSSGHYEYLVMPFGLANSLPVFQSFINNIFRDMINHWVIMYIDDILIHSNSMEERVAYMKTALQCLIDNHLCAKAEKYEFHLTFLSFLGYVISSEGVTMDDAKVKVTSNWPLPRTVKQLQQFLGFVSLY